MKRYVLGLVTMLLCSCPLQAVSLTDSYPGYREICWKAATEHWYFQNFRSLDEYILIIELQDRGDIFAQFLLDSASPETIARLPALERVDTFGSPATAFFPEIGRFSGTTLRYIAIADQINKLFSLPAHAKIAEIGAGFGGQAFVISQLQSYSIYYIYDLLETAALITKMADCLPIPLINCLSLDRVLPEKEIDLLISNYAFSECDRETQISYIENVICKARRGYIIYNQIAKLIGAFDCLSPTEFVDILLQYGIEAQIWPELVSTHPDNVLIVWDTTRELVLEEDNKKSV